MFLRLVTVLAALYCAQASINDLIPREVYPGVGEYFYISLPVNWTEAVRVCQACSSHLLVVDSTAEAGAVIDMMSKHNIKFLHVGFHDLFLEGKYITILGEDVPTRCTTNNVWAAGAPRGSKTYNCGGFSRAGITDSSCENKASFFCEVKNIATSFGPRDYVHIPHHGYYKYHDNETTWQVADQVCRDEGGHLVILNSRQEAQALTAEFGNRSSLTFHVGVHRYFGGDMDFTTVRGGTPLEAGFNIWAEGYPYDSYVNRPFVFYFIGTRNDTPGLATHNDTSAFICEYNVMV